MRIVPDPRVDVPVWDTPLHDTPPLAHMHTDDGLVVYDSELDGTPSIQTDTYRNRYDCR